MDLGRIWGGFWWILGGFKQDFSNIFRIFIENRDFVKNSVFLRKNLKGSGFRIFGGFSTDFNADVTYLYQQVSKYERHWAAAQDTVCRARGPRRKTHYVLHESRGLLGRWAC